MRPWLLITCGFPFSGKSTLARAVSQALGMSLVAVDEQHEALGLDTTIGNPSDRDWLRAYRAAYAEVDWKLAAGRSVVFDSVGFRRRDRDRARRIAGLRGARTLVIWLDVSADDARHRLEWNAVEPTRVQVPVASFERIVAEFELPDADEPTVIYRPDIKPATWIERDLRRALELQD